MAVSANGSGVWLFYEDLAWIDGFGIRYTLGMDGLSLLLVLLTALLQVAAVLALVLAGRGL